MAPNKSQSAGNFQHPAATGSTSPSLALLVTFVVAISIGLTLQKLLPVIDIAMSSHAKLLCSAHFISRRDMADFDASLELGYAITLITDATVHFQEQKVVSSIFGIISQTSKYLGPYRGCVLVGEAPLRPEPSRSRKLLDSPRAEWPIGDNVDLASSDESSELAVALDSSLLKFWKGDWKSRAILVAQHGRIVYEKYSPGFHSQIRFPGHGMTQSIFATLIGIRIAEGALGLNDSCSKWFPDWRHDERAKIKVKHLLEMTSGLTWIENFGPVTGGELLPMLYQDSSCVERPKKAASTFKPGAEFTYSSASSNLLSEILRSNLKYDESYWTYPYRVLFERIGADSFILETDRTGTFNAASFSHATARDWARFGLLYLLHGKWVDGQNILSDGWDEFVSTPRDVAHKLHGAHFWTGGVNPGQHDIPEHFSYHQYNGALLPEGSYVTTGIGGQMLAVVPSEGTVVVRLGLDNPEQNYGELVSTVLSVLRNWQQI